MNRIGIISGSFDPVHKGHIAIALQAAEEAKLDKVYLVPEPKPRRKVGVTHIAHRQAMLGLATRAHPNLAVLELPDKNFTAAQTLPRLRVKFPDSELVLIVGSDMLEHMPSWPLIENLLNNMELVVIPRNNFDVSYTRALITRLPKTIKPAVIIGNPAPKLASNLIRKAIATGRRPNGLSPSVEKYIKAHWLYSSPASSVSSTSSS